MHSQPSDLPKFNPGDSIRARTLNHVANITKAASTNTQSLGMHGHSTSTGTSYNLSANIKREPIWAQITAIRKQYPPGQYPRLEDPECPAIAGQFDYCFAPYNPQYCPNYLFAYSWVELKEEYDLNRHGSEVFKIDKAEERTLPYWGQPANQFQNASYSGKPFITYPRSCRDINKQYSSSFGGMYGGINEYPLYEVNNALRPVGFITKIWFGNGNYMLMGSTNYRQKKVTVGTTGLIPVLATKTVTYWDSASNSTTQVELDTLRAETPVPLLGPFAVSNYETATARFNVFKKSARTDPYKYIPNYTQWYEPNPGTTDAAIGGPNNVYPRIKDPTWPTV